MPFVLPEPLPPPPLPTLPTRVVPSEPDSGPDGGSGSGDTVPPQGVKEDCVVCLGGYVAGDEVATLPCNHEYHKGCVLEWLARSRTCPLCRHAVG